MLVSIIFYGFVSFRVPARPTPTAAFFHAIGLVSILSVVAIFFVRRILLARSEQLLAAQPEDKTSLGRWRSAYIVTWALCESIALYGIVLRFAGFSASQVAPFFIAGFALMLWFAPRRPVEAR
jgi:hypothetical protein